MILRSLLFVPGDRPERMEKAIDLGAHALILDLEDAVAPPAKPFARVAVAAFLRAADRPVRLFVRINQLDGGLADDDLAAVLDARPDGIVLPKCDGAESVTALRAKLVDHESVAILPIATETPPQFSGSGLTVPASERATMRAHLGGRRSTRRDRRGVQPRDGRQPHPRRPMK
jgi:citrate lyase subunit beta / citryl-CoA lyase